MVFIVFTQLQIYEEDFKREKREKESLQQQLRAKNSAVSNKISAIHFAGNQLQLVQNMVMSIAQFITHVQNCRNVASNVKVV